MRWQPDAVGRLQASALELFAERGYDATTVADIAGRAGLTRRTFFRHFTDKREVLFVGSEQLLQAFLAAMEAADLDAPPLDTVIVGVEALADIFGPERHQFARTRAAIISSCPELHERELIKLASMSAAAAETLRTRRVPGPVATLAADTGVNVFHATFTRWIAQDDPAAFRRILHEVLRTLSSLIAHHRSDTNTAALT